jgi:hypothetical protein
LETTTKNLIIFLPKFPPLEKNGTPVRNSFRISDFLFKLMMYGDLHKSNEIPSGLSGKTSNEDWQEIAMLSYTVVSTSRVRESVEGPYRVDMQGREYHNAGELAKKRQVERQVLDCEL